LRGKENCRSLGYPGFPVELGGAGELHAPFLTERRTRGPVQCCVAGNPGTLGMTKGRVALSFGVVAGSNEQQVPPLRYAPVGMTNLLCPRTFDGTCSIRQLLQMKAPLHPLSSRAQPRDLQLLSPGNRCPLRFVAQIICHPDRSAAEWRDLLFRSICSYFSGVTNVSAGAGQKWRSFFTASI
jgi:hypothetical protein